MTFVLTGKSADGAVLIADRRVIDQHRVERVTDEHIKSVVVGDRYVLSFDGINSLWEGIPQHVKDSLAEMASSTFIDCLQAVSEGVRGVWKSYQSAIPDDLQFNVFVGGLREGSSGPTRLYTVGQMGLTEEITDFQCGGFAGLKSQNLVRLLWDSSMTVDQLWRIGVFCCAQLSQYDLTVGGVPTVHLVRDDEGVEELTPSQIGAVYERSFEATDRLRTLLVELLDS